MNKKVMVLFLGFVFLGGNVAGMKRKRKDNEKEMPERKRCKIMEESNGAKEPITLELENVSLVNLQNKLQEQPALEVLMCNYCIDMLEEDWNKVIWPETLVKCVMVNTNFGYIALENLIEQCPNLKSLCLYHCREIYNDLWDIIKLSKNEIIEHLDLSYTYVTDKALNYLFEYFPNLQFLDLEGCGTVEDCKLIEWEKVNWLPGLEVVDLQKTNITENELQRLQEALPLIHDESITQQSQP